MPWKSIAVPFVAVALTALLASTDGSAAGATLHFDLLWHPNHSITMHDASGHVLAALRPGQQSSIDNGPYVLTMSLRSAAVPKPPGSPAVSKQSTRLLAQIN